MLEIVEKWIRREKCHTIHQYTKTNNKYMKEYDKSKQLYLKYLDINN